MHFLHITNHIGTTRNIQNVFHYLNGNKDETEKIHLTTEKHGFPTHINKTHADEIWVNFQKREDYHQWDHLIFTDTTNIARPFLQNIDSHSFTIILYITNRFDWGPFHVSDQEYYTLLMSFIQHPRVLFLADNRYDQYYTSVLHSIPFFYPDIVRLTPLISQDYSLETSEKIMIHNSKLFIYNRGNLIHNYKHFLPFENEEYDIYGHNGYSSYRDEYHISEYLGFLHLPYQTNIQSLWENLGHAIIYFIPSKTFLKEIVHESWYYWEEKTSKPWDLINISIDLAEWYQPENETYFVFFDSWTELKELRDVFIENNSAIFYKKKHISQNIKESNFYAIHQWKNVFSALSPSVPLPALLDIPTLV